MERIVLIDVGKLKFVKVCPTVRQCEYWAELLCKNRDFRIQGPEHRYYSVFTYQELSWLYLNSGGPSGKWTEYSQAIQGCAALADMMPLDDTPEEKLIKRLGYELPPTNLANENVVTAEYPRPSVKHNGDEVPNKKGVVQNNQTSPVDKSVTMPSRSNSDASHSEEDSDMAATKGKKTAKPKATATVSKATKDSKAAPKEKVAKVEQNGIVRPRSGGKCAAVWDIADGISKSKRRPAEAAEVMEQAEKDGLSPSNARIEFQRWRRFNGLAEGAKKKVKGAAKAVKKAA